MQVCSDAISNITFATLRYPKNSVFRFQGYNGIADKERLIIDIKQAAFIGGTILTNYTSHNRQSKLWHVMFYVWNCITTI